MRAAMTLLPRTVIVLGAVSFLNDAASDMITPLLPLFLTAALGAGPAIVGLVEGLAEASSSLLKLVSGWLADHGWNPKRLVVSGYTVSNVTRPLIGLAASWGLVMALRFVDRVGKGLRTSPRDAMIALAVEAPFRGRAFGFHRAMDHGGAMFGPLVAFALLQAGMDMTDVFLASVIPGVLVVMLLIFALPSTPPAPVEAYPPRWRWRDLDGRVKALVLAAGGLALATTPEAFIVLWASTGGVEIVWVPLMWAAAHGVRAMIATPAGILSDQWGRTPVLSLGWLARVSCLIAFALYANGTLAIWLLFMAYACATAFTEGAERALIGDYVSPQQRGTAFGIYHLISGVLSLPGAVLFGLVWEWAGMSAAFVMAAALTTLSVTLFLAVARSATVVR